MVIGQNHGDKIITLSQNKQFTGIYGKTIHIGKSLLTNNLF